jgi:hypothetical protein
MSGLLGHHKESCKYWIPSNKGSFVKEMVRKRSIDWLNGMWVAAQRTKVDLVYKTLRSRTKLSLVSAFSSFLQKMGFGKLF